MGHPGLTPQRDEGTLSPGVRQPARVPAPIFDEDVAVQVRQPPMTARQWRDLIGLALVILGVVGLVVTAWLWHPLAGLAATSAALVAAGLALGYDW
jgi:hypothetical protein